MSRSVPVILIACLVAPALAEQSQMSPQRRAEMEKRLDQMPAEVRDVYIDEHAGDSIPLDLAFRDTNGDAVRLSDYIDGSMPVILTLNYYRCPRLCDLLLNGAARLADEMDLTPGSDYRIVTVGFDPAETPALARLKKANLLNTLSDKNKQAVGPAWAFLTGEQPAIDALTDATGFKYKWLEDQKQYAHPTALIVLSPQGKITRYIYGTDFRDRLSTVRLSLVEASEGKVGSPLDFFLLSCFHYSPSDGKYTATVMGIMRLGGALTVLLIVFGIALLLLREFLHRRRPRKNEMGGLTT
ncbi:MAG: SCO family protein [Phycisphaeraceae bacterium]|nr:SCO family protein [Phycisphaeraceae bacterium]